MLQALWLISAQGKLPRSPVPGHMSLLSLIVAGPGLVGVGGCEPWETFTVELPFTIAVTKSCIIGSSFETTLQRDVRLSETVRHPCFAI